MRIVGDQLVPYNYPRCDPSLEEQLAPIKYRESIVDGYSIVLYYHKAQYKDYLVEILQIVGKTQPFLPFTVVVKIARLMLGSANLNLTEYLKDSRKIYCWSVFLDEHGKPMPPVNNVGNKVEFEGFTYLQLEQDSINLY